MQHIMQPINKQVIHAKTHCAKSPNILIDNHIINWSLMYFYKQSLKKWQKYKLFDSKASINFTRYTVRQNKHDPFNNRPTAQVNQTYDSVSPNYQIQKCLKM